MNEVNGAVVALHNLLNPFNKNIVVYDWGEYQTIVLIRCNA